MACGPSGAPREKLKDLLTEVDDMSKVWPHTLMQGDMDNEAEYTIVVDGHFALKAKTLTRAVKLLFVSYYVFNICNPIELVTQQTKLYYRNIITILSFAVFNISSAYYGNVAQENTTFTNITLPNNII